MDTSGTYRFPDYLNDLLLFHRSGQRANQADIGLCEFSPRNGLTFAQPIAFQRILRVVLIRAVNQMIRIAAIIGIASMANELFCPDSSCDEIRNSVWREIAIDSVVPDAKSSIALVVCGRGPAPAITPRPVWRFFIDVFPKVANVIVRKGRWGYIHLSHSLILFNQKIMSRIAVGVSRIGGDSCIISRKEFSWL